MRLFEYFVSSLCLFSQCFLCESLFFFPIPFHLSVSASASPSLTSSSSVSSRCSFVYTSLVCLIFRLVSSVFVGALCCLPQPWDSCLGIHRASLGVRKCCPVSIFLDKEFLFCESKFCLFSWVHHYQTSNT